MLGIMMSRLVTPRVVFSDQNWRRLSTGHKTRIKVAVCGASGGIGQPLSLLLKQEQSLIAELSLYDIGHAAGVAADLSHLPTNTKVKGYVGRQQLRDAIKGAHLVVIPAGVPRKPGMSRDDLFDSNAGIVKEITQGIAESAPKAIIGVITNPVNSTVPIAAEVLKKAEVFDPKKLFGVTTLDIIRAKTFIAEAKGLNPVDIDIPVIGGHAGTSIIPLVSRVTPAVQFSQDQLEAITRRIQEAGTEVVKAKAGAGSATLSMAHAAALFTIDVCRALKGEPNIVHCAYVSTDDPELRYLATPVLLGPEGIQENLGIGTLSDYEAKQLKEAIPILKNNIQRGEEYARRK